MVGTKKKITAMQKFGFKSPLAIEIATRVALVIIL